MSGATDVRRPNLFLVGAAKAGTSSLHSFLATRPDIWMSRVKEPGFFCADETLVRTTWARDLDAYLSLFTGGAGMPYRGESTPAYLASRRAAERIAQFAPDPRIIIVLRNPIDAIQAVYAEARKYGLEPERRFADAWRASASPRPKIEQQPGGLWLRYREVMRYPEQLTRYERAFGDSQRLVLRFDDLVSDPTGTCRRILRFLGTSIDEIAELPRKNEHYTIRSRQLARFLSRHPVYAQGRLGTALLKRTGAMDWLRRANRRNVTREPLDDELHAELQEHFCTDIEWLEQNYGWDLVAWKGRD